MALPFDPSLRPLRGGAPLGVAPRGRRVLGGRLRGVRRARWWCGGTTDRRRPTSDVEHMVAQLTLVADARFGPGGWSIDRVMRQIPNHFHAHGRDPNWWFRSRAALTPAACSRRPRSPRKRGNWAPVGCPTVEAPRSSGPTRSSTRRTTRWRRHGDAGGRLRRDELVHPAAPPGHRPGRAQPPLPVVGAGGAAPGLLALNITFTVFVVALPTVKADFHTNFSVLAWASTGPLLAFGVAAPFFGKVGDLFGHRRLYQFGLLGAMVSAVLTASAPDVGHASLRPRPRRGAGRGDRHGVDGDHPRALRPEDRVKALGWWSLVGAGGPVLGVTLGSPVIQYFGWRTLFWGQLVLLVIASVVVAVLLPTTRRRRRPRDRRDRAGPALERLGGHGLGRQLEPGRRGDSGDARAEYRAHRRLELGGGHRPVPPPWCSASSSSGARPRSPRR